MTDPHPTSQTSHRLRYLRGIDGLRAIAVMAVLLYHAPVSWMPGGFLGVEVFFVISGYLITALLLDEHHREGSTDLRAFWLRRGRRLLPAVLTLIAVVVAVWALFLRGELAALRGDAASSLTYVTNWYLIFGDESYFEHFGRPSPLLHLWSLAIEEQFYLLWPLAFVGLMRRFGRRGTLAVVGAGAVASTLWMWVLFQPGTDPSRLYYGTDTRAGGLLLGAALAFVWHPARLSRSVGPRAPVILDAVGTAALAALLWTLGTVGEFDAALYRGGFLRVALLTTTVLAVAAHPAARFGRYLGVRPLRWIGLRSYGIYLWHWPVYVLTRPDADVPLDGPLLLVGRIALSFALADLSYRWIEQPVRGGALGRRWSEVRDAWTAHRRPELQRLGLAGAAGAVALLLVIGTVLAAEPPPERELVVAADQLDLEALGVAPTSTTPSTTQPTPRTGPALAATTSTTAPLAVPGILAVGDSIMLGASEGMALRFGDDILVDAAVSRTFEDGIWIMRFHREAGTLPDVVIVHLGSNEYFPPHQFDEMMVELAEVPRVVFLTSRVNLPHQDQVNAIIVDGVNEYDNAFLGDWKEITEGQGGLFYEDGTHLDPDGVVVYTDFLAAVAGIEAS